MKAREYDFAAESDHLNYLTRVICHLIEYMDENPVSYPKAMLVYATLRFGLIPSINVQCEHAPDGVCKVSASSPCGGLDDTLVALDEAYETIDLEMDYECPSHVYSADYSI